MGWAGTDQIIEHDPGDSFCLLFVLRRLRSVHADRTHAPRQTIVPLKYHSLARGQEELAGLPLFRRKGHLAIMTERM